jgi:hypothetical protein
MPMTTADWRVSWDTYTGPECELCYATGPGLAPCVPGDANSAMACAACRADWLATMRFSVPLGAWVAR